MENSILSDRPAAGFKEYEDGKHRRYELMFKVNGAAFAIASLAFKAESRDFIQHVLGLRNLGIGMALFTIVMGVDIFSFGWHMKQLEYRYGKGPVSGKPWLKRFATWLGPVTPVREGLFRPTGMVVLCLISGLIVAGWLVVAYYGPSIGNEGDDDIMAASWPSQSVAL